MCLTTYLTRTTETKKYYRGVAQLGARDIWDVEAAGSNPVTPTIQPPVAREFFPLQAVFYCFSAFSAAIFAFTSTIISASFFSHSSRVCAYMLKLLRINALRFGEGLILLASRKALSIFYIAYDETDGKIAGFFISPYSTIVLVVLPKYNYTVIAFFSKHCIM